jgi:hypothetical protein
LAVSTTVCYGPSLFLLHFKSGAAVQKSNSNKFERHPWNGFQEEFDVEALRERLRKMSDAELLCSGKAARFMCSPGADFGKLPRECFAIQLREARAEWKRRNK